MKIKFLLVPFTILAVSTILIAFFAFSTIKNSTQCNQFVIDTYELASGIDIPKQNNASCYYDEKNKIRTGIYSIAKMDDFISRYRLKIIELNPKDLLWSQQYLNIHEAQLPHEEHAYYCAKGEDSKYKWQCLLDRNTGQLWFEIQWL
ncbi:hypothetical protein [Membranihabitans marinus]|uniref:hypothetical protein n=1 Tax=Membranihabitans marinus TaxID=1227546 RepID=UPI001F2CDA34|nr:hypothetical protein [Membranihabitans marinus]